MEEQPEGKYELTFVTKDENVADLRKALEKNGARVVKEREMQKIRLAYGMKKQDYGYLGVLFISIPKDKVEKLIGELNLHENVLRYVLSRFDEHKVVGREEESKQRSGGSEERRVFRAPRKPTEPVLTNEALEKKIEEILK